MKTIAILDTETTGVDPTKDRLLEVACVLWSVEHRAVIEARSWLVSGATENAALAINGIAPALANHGDEEPRVLEAVLQFVSSSGGSDAFTAWNSDFDRQWLGPIAGAPTWFDAMDLEWPRSAKSAKLVDVALAHGVGVVDAHRALTDCLTIARLFERVAESMQAKDREARPNAEQGHLRGWFERALRPKKLYEVADRGFDADRNALAKAAGFRWDAAKKAWRGKVVPADIGSLGFRVVEVRS